MTFFANVARIKYFIFVNEFNVDESNKIIVDKI